MERDKSQSRLLTLRNLTSNLFDKELYREMSFVDYLPFAQETRQVSFLAPQRMYQSVIRWGVESYKVGSVTHYHYNFFDDPFSNGKDAVFGLDRYLENMMVVLQGASARQGQEKRIFLLHGPVGSSKSTIARLLRRGLEYHTRTKEGQLYTFYWVAEDDYDRELMGLASTKGNEALCPNHEDPMLLLPYDVRPNVMERFNEGIEKAEDEIVIEGDICSFCRFVYKGLEKKYKDEKEPWKMILEKHVRVQRLVFSEKDRVGIGSLRPKDEKNQDSMELSGDINWRKIGEYGKESDPRAFNFDGELQVSNRGFFFVEEMYKFDRAFLYDFLGVSQEHVIKPKRLQETYLDLVLMGGTNNPDYEGLKNDEKSEAICDRTTPIVIPYVLQLKREQDIYRKVYKHNEVPEPLIGKKHLAPHTVEMASRWAIFTRLMSSKIINNLSLNDKVDLYDGKSVQGYGEEKLQEIMNEFAEEGTKGISPRFIQDMLGRALVKKFMVETPEEKAEDTCADWFAVKAKVEMGLKNHPLIKTQEAERYRQLLAEVTEEFNKIVQDEVQQAVASDENALTNLFNNYITNVRASVKKEKIRDPRQGYVAPNEELMAAIEDLMNIQTTGRDNHRQKLLQIAGDKSLGGEIFNYKADEKLLKALKLYLFNEAKDKIKLTGLVTGVVDKDEQEKIDVVKKRLKEKFNYCDVCATNVLNHVAGIFARGGHDNDNRRRK